MVQYSPNTCWKATREAFGFVYGYQDNGYLTGKVQVFDVIFVGTDTFLFIDFKTKFVFHL